MSASAAQPSEAELRAYEEELDRITSTQLILQTAASLLNVGGRRLGLGEGLQQGRDLEQVRDAVDGVMALLPILERRMQPAQVRPLRDALSQLQMAYARMSQAEGEPRSPAGGEPQTAAGSEPSTAAGSEPTSPAGGSATPAAGRQQPQGRDEQQQGGDAAPNEPGPAERSGRLWVPGR